MKTLVTLLLMAVVLVGVSAVAVAADSGSKEEATALVKKAIDFYKANGKDKAFAEINNRKGQFVDRDLYVVVYDTNGKCLAHGSNAKLIGQDLLGAKDVDGKEYVKERVEMMKKGTSGWQDYKFRNPATNQIEPKSMYIEKHEDLIFGCGAYNK